MFLKKMAAIIQELMMIEAIAAKYNLKLFSENFDGFLPMLYCGRRADTPVLLHVFHSPVRRAEIHVWVQLSPVLLWVTFQEDDRFLSVRCTWPRGGSEMSWFGAKSPELPRDFAHYAGRINPLGDMSKTLVMEIVSTMFDLCRRPPEVAAESETGSPAT